MKNENNKKAIDKMKEACEGLDDVSANLWTATCCLNGTDESKRQTIAFLMRMIQNVKECVDIVVMDMEGDGKP